MVLGQPTWKQTQTLEKFCEEFKQSSNLQNEENSTILERDIPWVEIQALVCTQNSNFQHYKFR